MANFLYSGKELPEIPDGLLDGKFSCAYMGYFSDTNSYRLLVTTGPMHHTEMDTTTGPCAFALNLTDQIIYYKIFYVSDGKKDPMESTWQGGGVELSALPQSTANLCPVDYFFWSNSGMYDATKDEDGNYIDGGMHLPASNPVPVITSISIRCPDSVMQGSFIVIVCDSPEGSYVDFTCTLSGNTSSRTKLMNNSSKTIRLQCGSDELANELLIEVASVDNPSLTASKTIAVIPYGGSSDGSGGGSDGDSGDGGDIGDIESSLVTDISLYVHPDTVVPGGHSLIEVSVNGIGNYSQAFTAQIGGYTSAATHMVTGGYGCNVWIAEDETADYVLVTVTSVQDPTITATEMIFIDQSATEEEGTTAEQLQNAYWKGFSTCRAYFQQTKLSEGATIRITKDGDEPSIEAGQMKRAFWKGFVACLGTFEIVPAEYVAYLENGVLYIKKAPATLNGNTLEV